MTSKMKVNRSAEFVEHISSCQPNFLSEACYQLGEGKIKLAIWNFSLHFWDLYWVLEGRREKLFHAFIGVLQSQLFQQIWDPPCVSCANAVAAGKGQAVCECAALLLFLPCGAQQGGTGRSVWAPQQLCWQRQHLWLEAGQPRFTVC